MSERMRVLFLCTGNACRSQMAEGWAHHLQAGTLEAWSAGTAPQGVDPRARLVMAEAGVDISGQRSKHVDQIGDIAFDRVITLCDRAAEACPVFPGRGIRAHRGFDDPPALARGAASEAEALAVYRRVRDEIRAFVAGLPESLQETAGPSGNAERADD